MFMSIVFKMKPRWYTSNLYFSVSAIIYVYPPCYLRVYFIITWIGITWYLRGNLLHFVLHRCWRFICTYKFDRVRYKKYKSSEITFWTACSTLDWLIYGKLILKYSKRFNGLDLNMKKKKVSLHAYL